LDSAGRGQLVGMNSEVGDRDFMFGTVGVLLMVAVAVVFAIVS
jgi:hypothetical protein